MVLWNLDIVKEDLHVPSPSLQTCALFRPDLGIRFFLLCSQYWPLVRNVSRNSPQKDKDCYSRSWYLFLPPGFMIFSFLVFPTTH